jgi:hypothetical protein
MRSETKPLFVLLIFLVVIVQAAYSVLFIVEILVVDKHILRHVMVVSIIYAVVAFLLLFSMWFLELVYVLKFLRYMYDTGIDENTRNVLNVRIMNAWFLFVVTCLLWSDYSANFDSEGNVSQYWYESSVSYHRLVMFAGAACAIIHLSLLVVSMRGYYPHDESAIVQKYVLDAIEDNIKKRQKTLA